MVSHLLGLLQLQQELDGACWSGLITQDATPGNVLISFTGGGINKLFWNFQFATWFSLLNRYVPPGINCPSVAYGAGWSRHSAQNAAWIYASRIGDSACARYLGHCQIYQFRKWRRILINAIHKYMETDLDKQIWIINFSSKRHSMNHIKSITIVKECS